MAFCKSLKKHLCPFLFVRGISCTNALTNTLIMQRFLKSYTDTDSNFARKNRNAVGSSSSFFFFFFFILRRVSVTTQIGAIQKKSLCLVPETRAHDALTTAFSHQAPCISLPEMCFDKIRVVEKCSNKRTLTVAISILKIYTATRGVITSN